ncbi:MAG: lytic transglycosylase domain-containing protein [Bacteroidales bacterium]|nr:lytic transglycosylase domain-containing protein [Bacteroidales bacterium]
MKDSGKAKEWRRRMFLFLLSAMIAAPAFSYDFFVYEPPVHQTPQQVYAPPIPDYVVFAGDTINLCRYDLRERFDREILAFSYMHSTTFLLIKRARIYFPVIEPLLDADTVPDDFKYLALIESYFNPRVVSPAKAAGIWQFMASTAEHYGLEVNEQVDERFNIEKSTHAACLYLKHAYSLYNDWVTAAASYNVGTRRISKELEEQRVSSALDLYLNEETSRYVFRILAAKAIIENPQRYGFNLLDSDYYQPVQTRVVEVNGPVENWADWAIENGTTYARLKDFNLWIRDRKLDNPKGKTYQVKIPVLE